MLEENKNKENIILQRIILIFGILFFLIKLLAWYLTNSLSILTDSLEGIINIFAGAFSLYGLYFASLPKDKNHPYGHGKIEFVASAIEGVLILITGILVALKSFYSLFFTNPSIEKLDYGIVLILITGIVNYILGYFSISKGKKNNSLILISGGKHLKSDTYNTLAIVLGLILIYFTKIYWLDSLIAIIFSFIIIFTGYKITREAIAGIMDEADYSLIKELEKKINNDEQIRKMNMHEIRFIKYGSSLHLDCHLVFPSDYKLTEVKRQMNIIEDFMKKNYGDNFEMYIHLDLLEDYQNEKQK